MFRGVARLAKLVSHDGADLCQRGSQLGGPGLRFPCGSGGCRRRGSGSPSTSWTRSDSRGSSATASSGWTWCTGRPGSWSAPGGVLGPASEPFLLSPGEPPTSTESRLLWEMARAVDQYVNRLFSAGILCPFDCEAADNSAERSDDTPS